MSLRAARTALLSLSAVLWPGLTSASPIAPRDVSICKMPARQDVYLSSGFGYRHDCVRSTGTLTAFMMFVDFPDSPHAEESAQDLYDLFLPDAANWFKYASYGNLTLDVKADTTAFYRMAGSSDSYDYAHNCAAVATHQHYIQDAIDAYTFNGQAMPTADLLYIVPTASAKDIANSCAFMAPVQSRDGSTFFLKAVTFGSGAFYTYGWPVLNHETGHALCLPDLYPRRGYTDHYVGGFDLMGDLAGPSPDLFAWDKWRLGWLSDAAIDCIFQKGVTRHVLKPLYFDAPGTKAVVLLQHQWRALVAEYRLDGGIDTATCSPGLLLYTVDTTVPALEGPIRVVDANPNTAGCDNSPLNDAALNVNGTKSLHLPEFGVTVEIVSQSRENITIGVNLRWLG